MLILRHDDVLVSCGLVTSRDFQDDRSATLKRKLSLTFIWFTRQWSVLESIWHEKLKGLCSSSLLLTFFWYLTCHLTLPILLFFVSDISGEESSHQALWNLWVKNLSHMIHRYPFSKVLVEEFMGWTGAGGIEPLLLPNILVPSQSWT